MRLRTERGTEGDRTPSRQAGERCPHIPTMLCRRARCRSTLPQIRPVFYDSDPSSSTATQYPPPRPTTRLPRTTSTTDRSSRRSRSMRPQRGKEASGLQDSQPEVKTTALRTLQIAQRQAPRLQQRRRAQPHMPLQNRSLPATRPRPTARQRQQLLPRSTSNQEATSLRAPHFGARSACPSSL